MLTVATVAVAAPLELLSLGLAGVAVVVAVGSAIAAYSARRTSRRTDDPADAGVRR